MIKWSTDKVKGKTFALFTSSKKFRLGKTKKTAAGQLKELGAKKVTTYQGKANYDHAIIGYETNRFHSATNQDNFLFEGELMDRSYQKNFKYFKDFDLKFYNMLRQLLAGDNIIVSLIQLGTGISEDTFVKYEKKLKCKIPLAIKEFYSIFGEIRVLWKFRNPPLNTGIRAGKAWNLDYEDNHVGSFQILPLQTLLFEKWNNPDYGFGAGKGLKLFDMSSDYYPVALNIAGDANPLVYRGDDHGVEFREVSPFLFTDYMNLCVNLFGKRERLDFFSRTGLGNDQNKSPETIQAALEGKLEVDITNDKIVQPMVDKLVQTIETCFKNKAYDYVEKQVIMELHNLKYSLFQRYYMELKRLKGEYAHFLERFETAATKRNLDWKAYEAKHREDPVWETVEYQKLKKKLLRLEKKKAKG